MLELLRDNTELFARMIGLVEAARPDDVLAQFIADDIIAFLFLDLGSRERSIAVGLSHLEGIIKVLARRKNVCRPP